MNKKASTFVVLITIIVILVVVLAAAAYYFVSNRPPSLEDTFQKILDEYSSCVNKKDIECQCNYLVEYHCEGLRESGSGPEAEYSVNAQLLKSLEGMKELGPEESNTRGISFFFIMESGEYSGSCFVVSFVEENEEWKVSDVDGPVLSYYCE